VRAQTACKATFKAGSLQVVTQRARTLASTLHSTRTNYSPRLVTAAAATCKLKAEVQLTKAQLAEAESKLERIPAAARQLVDAGERLAAAGFPDLLINLAKGVVEGTISAPKDALFLSLVASTAHNLAVCKFTNNWTYYQPLMSFCSLVLDLPGGWDSCLHSSSCTACWS
jgi:hypothetical protein